MSKSIWVYAELHDGIVAPVTLELIAKAVSLAGSGDYEVCAVLLGAELGDIPQQLISGGANKVILVEDARLSDYKTPLCASTISGLAKKYTPDIFILGATSQGRDLAPRIQAKLGTGLTADCLDLSLNEDELLVQSKPFYGDNFMCDIICPDRSPQMATVRPKVFAPLEPDSSATGEIIREEFTAQDDNSYEVVSRVLLEKNAGAVDEAERVIGLGAGADSDETIGQAKELAELLAAAIGVTRPLTDNGKFQHHEQIGQSGLTISPKVILNFGISGAVQYTVGIMNAELIISVDKNENAPIFRSSHYGYVGDIKALLPVMIKKLK